MRLILFTSLALPWLLVLQMAFWLAGATLLWIGGRFLAKLPRATFRCWTSATLGLRRGLWPGFHEVTARVVVGPT